MSIRTRLLASFMVGAALVGAVGVITWVSLGRISSAHDSNTEENIPATLAITEMRQAATELGLVAREEALSAQIGTIDPASPLYGSGTRVAVTELLEARDAVLTTLSADAADNVFANLGTRTDALIESANGLVLDAGAVDTMQDLRISVANVDSAEAFLDQSLNTLAGRELERFAEANTTIEDTISFAAVLTAGSAAAAVLVALAVGWFTAQRIARPIVRMQEAAVEIGRGNFETKVDVSSSDEIGVLGRAFNQMVDDITRSTVSKGYVDNIIKSMPDSLIVVDRQGRIETLNAATLAMLGFEAMELIGQPISSVMGRSANERDRPMWLESLSSRGSVSNIERAYLRKDGSEVPVLFSASMLRNDAGRVEGIICVAQDITERKEAEEQVRQSEERTRLIIDTALDAVVTTDADGHIDRWNRRAEETFGWELSEVAGKSLVETIASEEERALIEGLFGTEGEGKAGSRIEITARRRDGAGFPAEIAVSEADAAGARIYTAFIRDITDRKQAEADLAAAGDALVASEARARAIVENALDANVIMDRDGIVTGWNANAVTIFGWSVGEATGHRLSELIIPEPMRERHEQGIRHYLETGEGPILNQRIEITALRKDGSEFPLELSVAPIETPEGVIFSAFASDITARKEAEEALRAAADTIRESEEQLQTILESSPDMIISTGMDARILFSNSAAERLLGHTSDAMVGRLMYDMVHMEDLPRVLETYTASERGRERQAIEVRMRHADASWHWFESSFQFFHDEEGEAFGAVVISRDITERKRAEADLRQTTEELQRSNEELSQFAYVASHDLQEPLRMVSSYTKLLARRYQGQLDDNADEYIHFAVDGVTRMQKLIDDLLTYSRVGTRGRPEETVDTAAAVERALKNLEPLVKDQEAVITVDESMPVVTGDTTQLTQVFQNLINNGIKYRSDDVVPEIHIAARRKSDDWVFSVTDNGIGIDPKYHEKVFALFQRLHGREEFEGGTGIGLAICKKIIERHGGRIWVESSAGSGSTFYFTIPETHVSEED